MVAPRKAPQPSTSRRPPATTPDARENQLINYAIDLAEKQMLEGTASSQVITHYLKLASTRETLEKEKLRREVDVLRAKTEALEANKGSDEMYKQALQAMRSYQGVEAPDEEYY